MARMFGCEDAAIALASFLNRDIARSLIDSSSFNSFTATSRSSLVSQARYTSPMPPDPINDTIEYGPSRVLGVSGIDCASFYRNRIRQVRGFSLTSTAFVNLGWPHRDHFIWPHFV